VLLGAVCQIAATALLLRVMAERNFTLGVAYSKSELIQVAVFGFAFLGDPVSGGAAFAVALGTLGVLLLSPADAERPLRALLLGWTTRPALLGLLSGTGFALAAVGYRGAALALGDTPFLLAAAYTTLPPSSSRPSCSAAGSSRGTPPSSRASSARGAPRSSRDSWAPRRPPAGSPPWRSSRSPTSARSG
jgi:hypothetical protein